MSLLGGAPRNATARAVTTVTVGEISHGSFERLMETQPALRETLWQGFSERRFDNHLRRLAEFGQLGHEDRMRWFRRGEVVTLEPGETMHADGARYAFVVTGEVEVDGAIRTEGALVAIRAEVQIRALEQTRIARLPWPGARD